MNQYYRKVDGLRFIAIAFVLIEHFAQFIGSRFSAGYYGVDLFFVISGYLITNILLKSDEKKFGIAYKNFLGRRTLRIFPIYYLTILVLFLLQLEVVREYIGYLLTYTFNYALIYFDLRFTPVNHFWSLCVEEQFYIFWPFVVLGLRKNLQVLLSIIIVMIVVSYAQLSFSIIEPLNPYNYVGLLTRMGSLGFGALGAILYKTEKIPTEIFKNKYVEYGVYVLLIICLVTTYRFRYIFLGLFSLYLVLKASHSEFNVRWINNLLKSQFAVYIGTISYGIYVFHVPIAYYFSKYIFDPFWLSLDFNVIPGLSVVRWHSWIIKLPLFSALTIGVASLSYRFIEKPILSLKDVYFKN
ncbi:acyltransferase [Pollutibacter soli]|uniref:acyltransferase family protein n=1 Tax=Pollutibacter soli TaxID=3034157 RepID=UPI0030136FEE